MTAINPSTNARSGSTTWQQVPDRMRRSRREGQPARSPKASFRGLSKRNPRDKITVTITYRGGAEAWWLVEARGRSVPVPGYLDLQTVMCMVNQSDMWKGTPQR